MTYRQLQNYNAQNRSKLDQKDRLWLKINNYKNIGWNKVIQLFEKLEELQDRERIEDWSLEELFLESDRIGNKYLTDCEINDFNFKLAQEVSKISELIEQQFPDPVIEIIDYSKQINI